MNRPVEIGQYWASASNHDHMFVVTNLDTRRRTDGLEVITLLDLTAGPFDQARHTVTTDQLMDSWEYVGRLVTTPHCPACGLPAYTARRDEFDDQVTVRRLRDITLTSPRILLECARLHEWLAGSVTLEVDHPTGDAALKASRK